MKHLNIKWVPETLAIVSLTAATAHDEVATPAAALGHRDLSSPAWTRLIVISGGVELKANVAAVHRQAA